MEKRIELEKRGRKPEEIDQLILDDCRSTAIVGLTNEYTGLRSLSLINVGLTSLKGFPKLPLLLYLDVSENRISNSLQNLSGCIQIKSLNLGSNKLKDFEAIEPLKSLERLRFLDLSNNEVTKQQGYKEFVQQKFTKTLKYLDGDTIANGKTESDSDSDDDDDDDGSESEAEEECEVEEDDDDGNENENESEEYESDNEVYDESGDVGLEEMLKDNIDEESEGNDYTLEEEEEVDQDSSDESDDDSSDNDDDAAVEANESTANESQDTRGKKRKLDDK